jgi:hypothetical protein
MYLRSAAAVVVLVACVLGGVRAMVQARSPADCFMGAGVALSAASALVWLRRQASSPGNRSQAPPRVPGLPILGSALGAHARSS